MASFNFSGLTGGLPGAILFFLAWGVLWLPIAIPISFYMFYINKWRPFDPLSDAQKLPLIISLYVLAPVLLWGFASATGVSLSLYGLYGWQTTLLSCGIGIGIALLGVMLLCSVQVLGGWVSWQPGQGAVLRSILLPTLLLALGISWVEEAVFRGFLPFQLQQVWPVWLTVSIASLVFAVLHMVWQGWAVAPQLPGLWLMGMVLTFACWVDRSSIGLAWGLHAGWIWGIASLETAQILAYSDHAPLWVIGLDRKPLAGLLGILLLLLTGGALWGIRSVG
ncbi:MAG: CPBP family glutamic-type intramembrane protease [Leptolyngbyaceae cyanobacterium bins.59]|nr:CPBP family glutamic-type intramembrane protease [Leptolyngbyaceae cyanobacterium bins.59]